MRMVRAVVLFLFALAVVATPAYADRMDVSGTSGFGTVIFSGTTTFVEPGGGFTADVLTTVLYDSSTGVYTYAYSISNYTGGKALITFSIGSSYFDPNLDWGIVTGSSSASGVGLDTTQDTTFNAPSPQCNTGRNTGFLNCGPTLTFYFSDGTGDTGGIGGTGSSSEFITVYAQSSGAPSSGNGVPGILIDTDFATNNIHAPVPEPGTMALFGTGLLGIAAAIRRRMAK